MKAREIVKDLMAQAEISNVDMAKRLDITPAALWDRLNTKKTKDIPVSTLQDMLQALEYKLVIIKAREEVDGYTIGEENPAEPGEEKDRSRIKLSKN